MIHAVNAAKWYAHKNIREDCGYGLRRGRAAALSGDVSHCRGVVFAMAAEGHETKRVSIADVIRTEIAKGLDKWDLDQIQVMELAVKLLEE